MIISMATSPCYKCRSSAKLLSSPYMCLLIFCRLCLSLHRRSIKDLYARYPAGCIYTQTYMCSNLSWCRPVSTLLLCLCDVLQFSSTLASAGGLYNLNAALMEERNTEKTSTPVLCFSTKTSERICNECEHE